jgi:hypothetical protein
MRNEDETQTAYAIRVIREEAVAAERDRIMAALLKTDPVDWALAGSDALGAIVRDIVRDIEP